MTRSPYETRAAGRLLNTYVWYGAAWFLLSLTVDVSGWLLAAAAYLIIQTLHVGAAMLMWIQEKGKA